MNFDSLLGACESYNIFMIAGLGLVYVLDEILQSSMKVVVKNSRGCQ